MNGLPTSLRLNQPTGGRLTYSPYPTSALEEILGGITSLMGTAENIRQRRRQKELIDALLGGKAIPGIAAPETAGLEPLTPATAPEGMPAAAPTKSLLGKILGVISAPFDIRRPPLEPVPLEKTIAETMLEYRLKPKTAKEKLEERFLTGEELRPEQLQLIGAYVKPLSGDWETVKGDKYYWRVNPETGEMTETKIPVPVKEKEPTTIKDALGILKTYAGYKEGDLKKLGVFGLVRTASNIVKRQPEYAQDIAMDVDDYFDEMLEKYKGNYEKARKKTIKYMETLGVTEEAIKPYLRNRP